MGTNSSAGVYAIASTPFLDDGRIDEHSIDRLTDFFLESGVTGITVLGQMGKQTPKLAAATAARTNVRWSASETTSAAASSQGDVQGKCTASR